MRWRSRAEEQERARDVARLRRFEWHPWFAWYPVTIHETRVWWETVQRRRERGYWDYRMPDREYPAGCCKGARCPAASVQKCLSLTTAGADN